MSGLEHLNLHEAGELIKSFCEEDGFKMLYEFGALSHGFLDGGCYLLAEVLIMELREVKVCGEVYIAGRIAKEQSDEVIYDHVIVKIDELDIFLDANGAQSRNEVLENLLNELPIGYVKENLFLEPLNEDDEDLIRAVEDDIDAYRDLTILRSKLSAAIKQKISVARHGRPIFSRSQEPENTSFSPEKNKSIFSRNTI